MNVLKNIIGHDKDSYFTLKLDEHDIIHLTFVGFASKKIISGPDGSHASLLKVVYELKKRNKPVKLLFNIKKVTGLDSTARSQTKQLKETGIDQIAVVGLNGPVRMVAPYIVKSGNLGGITKFYATDKQALDWLVFNKDTTPVMKNTKSFIAPMAVSVILLALALWAWSFDKPFFRTIIPASNLVNPVNAWMLLILTLALIVYFFNKTKAARLVVIFASIASVLVGSLVIVDTMFLTNVNIDALLFTDSKEIVYAKAPMGTLAAVSLILLGSLSLLVASSRRSKAKLIAVYGLAAALLVGGCYSFLVYAFALEENLPIEPMNFVVTLVVLNLVYAIPIMMKDSKVLAKLISFSQDYWIAIVVFIVGISLTAFSWQYTRNELIMVNTERTVSGYSETASLMEARLNSNILALDEVKGFFVASDSVSVQEFNTFYKHSNFQVNYPGVSNIVYVKAATNAEKAQYVRDIRADSKAFYPEYASFNIHPESNNQLQFIFSYYEPKTISPAVLGFNLASEKNRSDTLESAMKSGQPRLSNSITLAFSTHPDASENLGFFLTVPIYKDEGILGKPRTEAERIARIDGFVSAYYRNKEVFGTVLHELNDGVLESDKVSVRIIDPTSGMLLYEQNTRSAANTEKSVKYAQKIRFADKQWQVDVASINDFSNISDSSKNVPYLVMGAGLLFTGLLTYLAVAQNRRTFGAFKLAEQMTEDLNKERDEALSVQKKDDAILASIGDAVFAIDEHEKIILFNPMAEYLSGYSAVESTGKSYKEILHFVDESSGKDSNKFIERALSGHITNMDGHTMLVTKSGAKIPVSDSAAPVKDENGKITGVIVVFRDVTQERALERSKDEFVSVASHQLRTPLSAMSWYTEMLLNEDAGKITEKQRELLNEVYTGNKRMTELVGSLLDASRLDLGKLENVPEDVDLRELIKSVHGELLPTINQKHQVFTQDIEANVPLLTSDPKLLRMIVQNLLSNAVKYTPEKGRIALSVALAKTDNKPVVRISVKDTGMGIPAKQHGKLFSKMFRADNVLELEGTGLGLYIVREAARKLGGDVTFKSVEGKGSTFVAEVLVHSGHVHKSAHHRGEDHAK